MNDDPTKEFDAVQEELVAYLDGELDPNESALVERRLSQDAEYRQLLRELQRSWDLMDELPRSQVDDSFAKTTVEMVAVSAAADIDEFQKRQDRWRGSRWLLGGMAIAAMALIGFVSIRVLGELPNKRMLRDLPVIENIDAYTNADSVEFLRSLDAMGIFATETPEVLPVAYQRESVEQRQLRILEMPAAEKEELSSKAERFARLSLAEQKRLRSLYHEIDNDPESANLWQVMQRYRDWLTSLPAGQRYDLLSMNTSDRVQRIESILDQQETQRIIRIAAAKMGPEDVAKLLTWSMEFASRHEEELTADASEYMQKQIREADPRSRGRFLLMALYQHPSLKPTDSDIAKLEELLSPEARKVLNREKDPAAKFRMVGDWIRSNFEARFRSQWGKRSEIPKEDLEKFFNEKLDDKNREYLLSLGRDRMHRELVFYYSYYERHQKLPPRPGIGSSRFRPPDRKGRGGGDRGGERDGKSPPVPE